MKLKNKIIHILTGMAASTCVVPMILTSCSHNEIKCINMLTPYVNKFTPHDSMVIEVGDKHQYDVVTRLYDEYLKQNNQIVFDDIYSSWSHLLTDNDCLEKINEYVSFTKYELGLTKKDLTPEESHSDPDGIKSMFNFHIKTAGEAKNLYLDFDHTKKLKTFDLDMTLEMNGTTTTCGIADGFGVMPNIDTPTTNVTLEDSPLCYFPIYQDGFTSKSLTSNISSNNVFKVKGTYSYIENDVLTESTINKVERGSFDIKMGSTPILNFGYLLNNSLCFSLIYNLFLFLPKIVLSEHIIDANKNPAHFFFTSNYFKFITLKKVEEVNNKEEK